MKLATNQLSIGYVSGRNQREIGRNLSLDLPVGKLTALLGSNGSGKSTLIRTLAGLQPPLAGSVLLGERALSDWNPADLAKTVAVVLQESLRHMNLTVFDLVALGRTPYTNWLGSLSDHDKAVTMESMKKTGVFHLAERKIAQLSDGEWQKVMLSKALAQNTPIILLDEPTAHLDLLSKIDLVDGLKQTAAHDAKSILFSTHDLDLALKVSDYVWLMDKNGSVTSGVPEDLVIEGLIEKIYTNDSAGFDAATGNIELPNPIQKTEIRVTGTGLAFFWTQKALSRSGYKIATGGASNPEIMVSVYELENRRIWEVKKGNQTRQVQSIGELLSLLASHPAESLH